MLLLNHRVLCFKNLPPIMGVKIQMVKTQERRILYFYNLLQKRTSLFSLISYGDHNAFTAAFVNAFCGFCSESKQTKLNSPVSELDSVSLPEREASLISNFKWSNYHMSGLYSLYQVFIFV